MDTSRGSSIGMNGRKDQTILDSNKFTLRREDTDLMPTMYKHITEFV